MVVWDSQVQDGFKRSRDAADSEQPSGEEARPAAAAWDGKRSSSVVEELLKDAADKAYGTEGKANLVLSREHLSVRLSYFFNSFSPPLPLIYSLEQWLEL